MRSGDQLSQISDDDYYAGGICPSCRLAINKDTGRLKWCVGRNKFWRAWIRYMLLIPAVILPVTIIFIALSRSTVVGKFSLHQPIDKNTERRREFTTESSVYHFSTIQSNLEQSEGEDRVILSDVETSFVPTNSFIETKPKQRHKREMHKNHFGKDSLIWNDFNYMEYPTVQNQYNSVDNLSSSSLKKKINSQMRYYDRQLENLETSDKYKNYFIQKEDFNEDYENDEPELQVNYFGKLSLKPGQIESARFENRNRNREYLKLDSGCPDEKVEDFLVNDNPEVEIEMSDSTEADANDYEEANELVNLEATVGNLAKSQMPWQLSDSVNSDEMDEDYESLEPDDYEEEDDLPIFDNSWMQMVTLEDKTDGFHTFWKGEGNRNTIRKTQAKMMLKYMDKTADPCSDFYQYACGNWAAHNPIPKDKAGYDTFEMLRESLDSVLKELLEEPIPQNIKDPNDAIVKAKHLFQSCMNYEILEQRMERPLLELLDELGGWPILRPDWSPEKFDWLLLIAQLRLFNNDILISEWVGPDIKNSDQYVIQFDQTSLGLPTRDYFLQPSNAIYLNAYKSYLIKIATLLGSPLDNAKKQADELIEFEKKLAKITSSPDERRNVSDLYKRMSIGELRVMVPQIDWHRYLSIVLARPANISEPVVIFALQYIQNLVNLISRTHPRTVSNYLLWRFVRHRVNNLDDRFQEAKQRFYYILFGREQAPLRWKNCVAQVNSNMGMAVGSMFVKRYFDENSKNDTLSMTQEIQQSFKELLNRIAWIDRDTKKIASEKVDGMFLRIGYPDFILEPELLNERYKDVVILPDKYFENTLNILHHLTRVEQDRLGSAVNKTLWNTAPAVVNAYYSRNKNQIMFPAGILQPPFYHRFFPRSLNYGGIGVVIGHEITHGFDDKGRLFDKDGNLHRWWKDEAIDEFHQRAQCLIDQYSRYKVAEVDMPIDGINTQGENIADNGGIKQAFRAYETWLKTNRDENENLPGINATGKQLFFLNFAQVWCGSMRPEATRNKLKTAVHSPGKFRVIGTLSNSKDFAQVFNCPLGTPMNPTKKCSVW